MKRLFLLSALALAAPPFLVSPASAAPVPGSGLGFDISMRVAATGKTEFPPQNVQAHVLLSGTKARIETKGASSRAVVLYTPPFVYRLLPNAKAGVKWKLSQVHGSELAGFDPQELLRSPENLRLSLVKAGAKRVQVTKLNGVPVEILELSRPGQRFSKTRAWLQLSNSLPLRIEANSGGIKVVLSWSNYTRLPQVSPTQFTPPKGFAIREAQNPPLLPIL